MSNNAKSRPRPSRVLRLIASGGLAVLGAVNASGADGDRGVFMSLCAPCHGPDGRARTPAARKLGVKDLTQSRLPDEEIRKQIVEGLRDKTGKQHMPAFGDKLTPEQITGLIGVVKEFRK